MPTLPAAPASAPTAADLPIVDVSGPASSFAAEVDAACRDRGFFYVVGHGVDEGRCRRLADLASQFFDLPEEEKAAVAMHRGGRAWRGWFGVGDELTSGRPDRKEGLYLGTELPPDRRPLHGPNLWPGRPAGLREAVLDHLEATVEVGQRILDGMAIGLGLEPGWFRRELTADPLVLFRLFHYPPRPDGPGPDGPDEEWGVGEHTDYGLLTLLWQDDVGGLEVRGPDGWVAAPPVPGSFVCNLGDMLDRMTGGRYRSTPHRAVNRTDRDRITFPLFLDPGWDAEVAPMPLAGPAPADDAATRWDRTSLRDVSGTYGDYLLTKVSRVFPDLFTDVV